jgi:3D (Asp-Asp-Asp) domain-containing protein
MACIVPAAHAQKAQIEIDPSSIPTVHRTWLQTFFSYLGIRATVPTIPVGTTLHVVSSAYAPTKYQTDASPCITASGTRVRPGVIATNFLPLGTIISIENKKYIVEDRMNARYTGYIIDIWLPSTQEAINFGRQVFDITIVGYGKPGDSLESPTPTPVSAQKPVPEKTIWKSITDSAQFIGEFLVGKANNNRYDVSCTD